MADVARSVSKVAHGPFLLEDLEPTASGSAPAWAGSTKNQVGMARKKQGRSASKTVMEPVKRGMTPPRKFQESKRHLAVDMQDFAHGVGVTTAEMRDRKGALFALQQEQTELRQVQCVLCDSGYVGTPLSQGVRNILG